MINPFKRRSIIMTRKEPTFSQPESIPQVNDPDYQEALQALQAVQCDHATGKAPRALYDHLKAAKCAVFQRGDV
jgi:hypothetical protein